MGHLQIAAKLATNMSFTNEPDNIDEPMGNIQQQIKEASRA
jgi:hypothetical protein